MANNRLILDIGARLEATFATAFGSAQARINALGKELSELKRKQDLIKKFELQTQQVDAAKQKLEEARNKVDSLRQAFANDPTAGAAKRLELAEQKADKLSQALDKTQKQLDRTKERMTEAGLSTDHTTEQLADLERQAARTERAIQAQSERMERNAHLMGKLKLSVLDVADAHSGLAAKLLATKSAVAVLSAAVAGAVPVLGQMAATGGMIAATFVSTLHIAGVTKEMQGLSETTGMTTQSLRELQLLSGFEGVGRSIGEFGDATKSLEAINQRIMQIGWDGKKNENFAARLDEIGINVDELRGKKPDEVLLLIDDALKRTGATAREQENLFESIVGKGTSSLIPLLQKQNAELALARNYIKDVGAIQSDAEIAAMEQTNKELSLFKIGLEGVATRLSVVGSNVVNTLGPNIRQLFIDAKKPIGEWGEAVDKTLKKFKSDLDNGGWGVAFNNMFKDAYPTLHQFVSSAAAFGKGYGQAFIGPMLNELKQGYAGISSALAGAGGAEAVGRGMGDAMQPVIGIVHNVVGAVKLLISNWDTLKTVASFTPVGFVVSHWDAVVSVFSAVGNGIRKVGEALGLLNPATTASASGVQVFLAALGGLLAASASTKLALGLVGAAVSTFAFALGPLASALGIAATAFRALAAAAIANPIGAAIAVIATGAALIYANWDKIGPYFSGLWSGIKSTFSGAWTSIKTSVSEFSTSITQSVSKTWTDMSNSVGSVWGSIKQGAANGWTTITQTVSAGLNAFRQAHVLAFEAVKNIFGPVWTSFANLAKAGLSALISLVTTGWANIQRAFDLAINGLKLVVSGLWTGIKTIFSGAWDGIKSVVSTGWEGIKTIFKVATQVLQGDFAGAWTTIKTGVSNFIVDVLAQLRKTVSDFVSIGKDMLAGLGRGITEGASAAISKAKEVGSDIYNSVKEFFVIRSPSRLMAGLGLEVSAGLAVGIESAGGKAIQAAASVSVSVSDEFSKMAGAINKTLTDSFMSLDFSNLGRSLVGIFKDQVVQPILSNALKPLSDGIANAFGGIGKSLSSLLSGGGFNLGSLFSGGVGGLSGIGSMVSSGLSGLGSALSGGLSGIMGSIGSFVSAIPGWGWALAGVAGLAKLFGGPSDPKLRFTQGATDGQAMLGQGGHNGHAHQYETVFGKIGATAASDHIGREKNFVPAFHAMMQQMQAIDQMIANVVPASIERIKTSLKGLESSGFSTADMLKQRYQTVFSALPEELQKALAQGQDITKLSAEQIIARFGEMSAAASALLPSLQQLGVGLGDTQESAVAAALHLSNAFGGTEAAAKALSDFMSAAMPEAERMVQSTHQALDSLSAFNASMGLTGKDAISSTQALYKFVQALDLTTEAGAKQAAAAMAQLAAAQHMDALDAEYRKNFYSPDELKQQELKAAQQQVNQMNRELGLSGSKAINTKDEFRKLVESLDRTTPAGQKAYETLMKYMGALLTVADAADEASKQLTANKPAAAQAADSFTMPTSGSTGSSDPLQKYRYSGLELDQRHWAEVSAKIVEFNQKLGRGMGNMVGNSNQFADYIKNLDLNTKEGRAAYEQAKEYAGAFGEMTLENRRGQITAGEMLNVYLSKSKDPAIQELVKQYQALNKGDLSGVLNALQKALEGEKKDKADKKEKTEKKEKPEKKDKVDKKEKTEKKEKPEKHEKVDKKQALDLAGITAAANAAAASLGKSINSSNAALTSAGAAVSKLAGTVTGAMAALGSALNALAVAAAQAAAKAASAAAAAQASAIAAQRSATPVASNNTSTRANGSHALGLRTVPFDGYRAILHQGEAVIPARDAAILRLGMPVMMDAQTNILSLSAANDEQPVSLPAGVTPLPQRVTQALTRANQQTQVDVNVPSATAPINITINAAAGQDAAQIAAEVEHVLKRLQQQQARQVRAQHRDIG